MKDAAVLCLLFTVVLSLSPRHELWAIWFGVAAIALVALDDITRRPRRDRPMPGMPDGPQAPAVRLYDPR